MAVPNFSAQVKTLHDTGLFDLKTEHGQGAFTDACVSMLNGKDANFGHLIKKPGQTAVHEHGEDSSLYKHTDGTATAVDFIGGAGGSNPQPGWIEDQAGRYKHTDWADPTDHGIGDSGPAPAPSPVIPGYETLGGDNYYRQNVGVPLQADTIEAKQQLNDGSAVWFSRTIYDDMITVINNKPEERPALLKKHRNEWRVILGLPELP